MLFSKTHWKFALLNLWRNPRRTLVTGLAIGGGFMGLCIFEGYIYRTTEHLTNSTIHSEFTGHFGFYKKNAIENLLTKPKKYSLSPAEQELIRSEIREFEPQIDLIVPLFRGLGLISNSCKSEPFLIRGIDPESKTKIYKNENFKKHCPYLAKTFRGEDINIDLKNESAPITLTANLSQLMHKKVLYKERVENSLKNVSLDCDNPDYKKSIEEDPSVQLMVKSFDGNPWALEANVVGLHFETLAFNEDLGIVAPLKKVQELYQSENVSSIHIFLKNISDLKFWKQDFKKKFEQKYPTLEVLFYDESRVNPFYVGIKSFMSFILLFYLVVIGTVITISVINSMTICLIERSFEIGTLRALGYKRSSIAGLFVIENFLLSCFSLVLGSLGAKIIGNQINRAHILFKPAGAPTELQLVIEPTLSFEIILSFIIIFVVLLITYFLTLKETRKNIVNLLIND